VLVQDDARTPLPWRQLTNAEQATFDLGHAVFNTGWAPANHPGGRRDGLGPLFNAQSCDACHNSRRRGRGPRTDGDAPADLVIQLGRRLPNGSVQRGIEDYGRILNTSAQEGFRREASVVVHYDEQAFTLDDGTQVSLRTPRYEVGELSGAALPSSTVLMPRMPPLVQGAGLLELVPQSEVVAYAQSVKHKRSAVQGRVSWPQTAQGPVIGRFGWQATEPSVATQTASAMSREMGLTTSLIAHIDCGQSDHACHTAEAGGTPEVEPGLFDALVLFQQLHAVPNEKSASLASQGAQLFTKSGCDACHRTALPVAAGVRSQQVIHAYTDLLLHDLGEQLADRDIEGNPVKSEWRTAPLWGLQASALSGQPLRLLHDGRARTIEEAILWHDGEARHARERYTRLPVKDRQTLTEWIAAR
jgi:CxxC motif-containing protein (DUF1111 family)